MEKNSLPNYNPANLGSPVGIMQEVLAQFARDLECCMPATVVSYDRNSHTAVVSPAVRMVLTTGETMDRANLSASVWRYKSGGYLIDMPISAGDTGWIIAADRDTSTFKETSATSKPNTRETHKYSAGFFIPDSFGDFAIAAEDDGRMVFQNLAGTEKISIGASDTKITSASLTISSAAVTITGDLTVDGDASIGGIDYLTHTHGGVTPGGGSTGVPQ